MISKGDPVNARSLPAGLDEVGAGSLAGPVTVAVVAFHEDAAPIEGVRDSKQLSRARRMELAPTIIQQAAYLSIGWASSDFINEHGIWEAWQAACSDALQSVEFSTLFVDGVRPVYEYEGRQSTVVRGDDIIWQIAAASIVAKVARDLEMEELGKAFPHYGWDKNAGYGTRSHIEAIKTHGPCYLHRRRFIRKYVKSDVRQP